MATWTVPGDKVTDLLKHGETSVPSELTAEETRVKEILTAHAYMIGLACAVNDDRTNQTYLLEADGKWLDAHAKDRDQRRTSGEADSGLRQRLRQYPEAITPAAITSAAQAILDELQPALGTVYMVEVPRDALYYAEAGGSGAAVFDGASLYLARPDAGSPLLDLSGAGTWAGWVRADGTPTTGTMSPFIAKRAASGQRSYAFGWEESGGVNRLAAVIEESGTTRRDGLVSPYTMTLGRWYHMAMVFDGAGATDADRLKVYVDASPQTLTFPSGSIPATLFDSNADTRLGADSTTWLLEGAVAYWRVWDNALTAAELALERVSPTPVKTSGLVVDWPTVADELDDGPNGYDLTEISGQEYPAGVGPILAVDDIAAAGAGYWSSPRTAPVTDGYGYRFGARTNGTPPCFVLILPAGTTAATRTAIDAMADALRAAGVCYQIEVGA